jgi:hypothetical protein
MSIFKQIKSSGYTLVIVGLGAAAAIILSILISHILFVPGKDYSIDVQAIKDEEDLFNTARVAVTNTGKLPLTNVVVSYNPSNDANSNNNHIDKIALLTPGEKVWLSPPVDAPLKSVRVTADQGLRITKQYASTFKIPGVRLR